VPGGDTGKLVLVDPDTQNIEIVAPGSETENSFAGTDGGITSADACRGLIYAIDGSLNLLYVVDPKTGDTVANVPVASKPEHVRFVADTNEVWVTEPGSGRIEIFILPVRGIPHPRRARFLSVMGGPESLVIDPARGRAYANLSGDTTLGIDIRNHKILGRWPNGCRRSRGMALDEKRGFLFLACHSGEVTVMDELSGKLLGKAAYGTVTDVIAYSQNLNQLYVLQPEDGRLAIVGISKTGVGELLKTVNTGERSNCMIADDREQVYVCDPSSGKLFTYKDSLAPSM
jgi:DNA-binding beta-propeller fold protein YncE